MVLEILCVEHIYPQFSGVVETCLALRYWFFEVLSSESVKRPCWSTVNSEIFARILFSRLVLKDIFAT